MSMYIADRDSLIVDGCIIFYGFAFLRLLFFSSSFFFGGGLVVGLWCGCVGVGTP
jgi:hypothetical protein